MSENEAFTEDMGEELMFRAKGVVERLGKVYWETEKRCCVLYEDQAVKIYWAHGRRSARRPPFTPSVLQGMSNGTSGLREWGGPTGRPSAQGAASGACGRRRSGLVEIDGKAVYAYVITATGSSPVFGFDVRPLDQIVSAWLAAHKAVISSWQEEDKSAFRAHILNQREARRLEDRYEFDERPQELSVEVPAVRQLTEEVLFRLNGIPWKDNYGACAVLADAIASISYADTEDLASGGAGS